MARKSKIPWSMTPPPPRTETADDARFELLLVFRTQYRSFRGALQASPEMAWGYALGAIVMGPLLLGLWAAMFIGVRVALMLVPPGALDGPVVSVAAGGLMVMAGLFSLASAGTTLSHSGTMPLLFSLPLRSRSILAGILGQQILLSSWCVFLGTAPALGLLWARHALLAGTVPVLAATVASALVMQCIAVFLGATIVRLIPSGRWQEWAMIIAGTGGAVGWYLFQGIGNRAMASADPAGYLAALGKWLPSWSPLGWTGGVAALAGQGHSMIAWVAGTGALAAGLALSWGLLTLLDRMYRDGLAAMPLGEGAAGGTVVRQLRARTGWSASPVMAMARREWRRLGRSPRYLLMGLMVTAMVAASILVIPGEKEARVRLLMVQAMMPFAAVLSGAVLGLMFVGNEEDAFWLTRLSPLTDREIVLGKFLAVAGVTSLIDLVLLLVAVMATGMDRSLVPLAGMHMVCASAMGTLMGLAGSCSEPLFKPVQAGKHAGQNASMAAAFGAQGWILVNGAVYGVVTWLVGQPILVTAGLILINLPLARALVRMAEGALSRVQMNQ
ncbi:MAG TPA: hypothetical protein VNT75_06655 [Symbiobacteriaceae bacterium]|nr:hypothetical protein [Symbiobacteriaceae bacterium]